MRVANLEWDNEDACVGILDYIECLYLDMLISNNHELCFVLVQTVAVHHFSSLVWYNIFVIDGYIQCTNI